jgi:signal transduction histidine kinase
MTLATRTTTPASGRPATTVRASARRWVPFAFVILALVALAALPFAAEYYTTPLREEIREVAEPGRTLLTTMQVALAMEGESLHDFLDTHDPRFRTQFETQTRDEQAVIDSLARVAAALGPDVERWLDSVRYLERVWHVEVARAVRLASTERPGTLSFPRRQYVRLLAATALLDSAITRQAALRSARIALAQERQRWASIALVAVALVAIAIVAALGAELRTHAATAERRRMELEAAIRSRARVMRGVTHDLKNPLTAIDGHAALLEEGLRGELTDDQRDSVGRIRRSVRSLLALIADLLELSRVEEGQLKITPRPTEPMVVVREVAEEHRPAATANGHVMRVDENGALPVVQTDPERVRQILGNLLSNAVKYAAPGSEITVRVESRPRADAGGRRWVAIDVVDRGVGIPADKLETIFEEFSRLDPRGKPGVGLGLAIARRISRLLGGELTASSALGQGSTFTLWLPEGSRRGSKS